MAELVISNILPDPAEAAALEGLIRKIVHDMKGGTRLVTLFVERSVPEKVVVRVRMPDSSLRFASVLRDDNRLWEQVLTLLLT